MGFSNGPCAFATELRWLCPRNPDRQLAAKSLLNEDNRIKRLLKQKTAASDHKRLKLNQRVVINQIVNKLKAARRGARNLRGSI